MAPESICALCVPAGADIADKGLHNLRALGSLRAQERVERRRGSP